VNIAVVGGSIKFRESDDGIHFGGLSFQQSYCSSTQDVLTNPPPKANNIQ